MVFRRVLTKQRAEASYGYARNRTHQGRRLLTACPTRQSQGQEEEQPGAPAGIDPTAQIAWDVNPDPLGPGDPAGSCCPDRTPKGLVPARRVVDLAEMEVIPPFSINPKGMAARRVPRPSPAALRGGVDGWEQFLPEELGKAVSVMAFGG